MPLRVGGVVDTKLKVYKTTGLRVIDAGVIPIEVSGESVISSQMCFPDFAHLAHTSSMLYAFALRGASLVLQDA